MQHTEHKWNWVELSYGHDQEGRFLTKLSSGPRIQVHNGAEVHGFHVFGGA